VGEDNLARYLWRAWFSCSAAWTNRASSFRLVAARSVSGGSPPGEGGAASDERASPCHQLTWAGFFWQSLDLCFLPSSEGPQNSQWWDIPTLQGVPTPSSLQGPSRPRPQPKQLWVARLPDPPAPRPPLPPPPRPFPFAAPPPPFGFFRMPGGGGGGTALFLALALARLLLPWKGREVDPRLPSPPSFPWP
jgi:hypothetical protein